MKRVSKRPGSTSTSDNELRVSTGNQRTAVDLVNIARTGQKEGSGHRRRHSPQHVVAVAITKSILRLSETAGLPTGHPHRTARHPRRRHQGQNHAQSK